MEQCASLHRGRRYSSRGIDLFIHKRQVKKIQRFEIIRRYNTKITQVYASTSNHIEEEIESFYEDIEKPKNQEPANYNVLIRDFNLKERKRNKIIRRKQC